MRRTRPRRPAALALVAAVALLAGSTHLADAHAGLRATGAATIWAGISRRCSAAADERLPSYPWPLAPFDRQHPVRGYFGDPRTVVTGIDEGAYNFHNGVDISAPTGAHVLPVTSGVVVSVSPDRVVVASADDRRFQYIHLRPWVRMGAHVVVSRSVLGIVDPVFHHVHLSEIRGSCVVNPLLPGHLTPFRDHARPVIAAIVFENLAGQRLSPLSLSGAVRIIARAYDEPAMPSPAPWSSMPVSPALVTWKLTTGDGRVLERRVAADFRVSIPPNRDFCQVYAPGTLQNFAAVLGTFRWGKPGVYLFDLTPKPLDTWLLHDGRYRFAVTAANVAGYATARSLPVDVRNLPAPQAVVEPALDTRCVRGRARVFATRG